MTDIGSQESPGDIRPHPNRKNRSGSRTPAERGRDDRPSRKDGLCHASRHGIRRSRDILAPGSFQVGRLRAMSDDIPDLSGSAPILSGSATRQRDGRDPDRTDFRNLGPPCRTPVPSRLSRVTCVRHRRRKPSALSPGNAGGTKPCRHHHP